MKNRIRVERAELRITQQHLGNYYPVLIAMCNVSVIYVLLYAFYKHNIFLKV